MIQRLAASLALIVFAVCLLVGGVQAGNSFATTVIRALAAMAGTYVVAAGVGWMAQRMLDEQLRDMEKKLRAADNPAPEQRT